MAGRTEAEAVQNFLDPLQESLSCVTDPILDTHGGYRASRIAHHLTLRDGDPVQLNSDADINLRISQDYLVVPGTGERGKWKVSTRAYIYELLDSSDRTIVSYHWHPDTTPHIPYTHLHMGIPHDVAGVDISKVHLPTGRVALEAVLRLAIIDFGVRPRRPDWAEVLDHNQEKYEKWRTWAGSGIERG